MRRPIIAGNWKMNMLISTAGEWVEKLLDRELFPDILDIIVAPPFTALSEVRERIIASKILLAGQNIGVAPNGALTGEISAAMLEDAGCDYVILGHSERRQSFYETDELINRKIIVACENELSIIFCVGETLDDRKNGRTKEVVEKQLSGGLADIKNSEFSRIVIAYEPVWAIGTGHSASPEQAQEVHQFIRTWCEKLYGRKQADVTRILYGGSVKPETSASLLTQPDLDGLLVGGASLRLDYFYDIISILKN